MTLGFRGQLILGTTTLVIAFVAAAVTLFAMRVDDYVDRELEQSVAEGRKSVLAAIDQRRAALRDETRFLAGSPLLLALAEIPGVDQVTLEDGFDEIQSSFTAPLLAVVDAGGAVIGARGGGWQAGQLVRDQPGIAAALGGEPGEHVWPHDQGLVLVGMAPLLRGDVLLGVLVRGEFVDHALARAIGRLAGRDVVLAHRGRVLGERWKDRHPDTLEPGTLANVRHDTVADDGVPVTVEVDGQTRAGIAIRLHPDAGIAFLPHDVDAILRLRDESLLYLAAAGLIAILLGILGAARTARRMTQPLHQLMDASRRIRDGDLSARVEVGNQDELGRLAQSFNSMAQTMQGLVADVTEKASRAEAANRAKDGFLMSISHELRTPLTGIQSTAELLQQFGGDASPAEREEFLATILTEAERLGRRIGDALEYATLASDRNQWTVSRVDLFAICGEARSRLDALRSLKRVEWRISRSSDAVLRGDRGRLTEALFHLMHNAWQWSPKDGIVNVSIQGDGDDLSVEVSDRGPGVPEGEREAVFDVFTQGGDVLVDKPQGIGIGLKIASEVAVAHGGRVYYVDRPGGGARFTMRLRRDNRPIDELAEAVEVAADD